MGAYSTHAVAVKVFSFNNILWLFYRKDRVDEVNRSVNLKQVIEYILKIYKTKLEIMLILNKTGNDTKRYLWGAATLHLNIASCWNKKSTNQMLPSAMAFIELNITNFVVMCICEAIQRRTPLFLLMSFGFWITPWWYTVMMMTLFISVSSVV